MRRARAVRPRAQLHRGTVVAAAFWFNPTLLGEGEARRRVLAAWTPGAGVFDVAGGLLLRLPQPRAVACSQAPGLPLTLEEGVLTSAPLPARERALLEAPAGSAVLVRAGRAEVYPLDGSRRVDVAAWLDVSGWRAIAVTGLGTPPPPVAVLEPLAAPPRERFGPGIPTLAPEAVAMMARMKGQPVPEALRAPPVARRPLLAFLDRPVFGVVNGLMLLVMLFGGLVCLLVLMTGAAGGSSGVSPLLTQGAMPQAPAPLPASFIGALLAGAALMLATLVWLYWRDARLTALEASSAPPAPSAPASKVVGGAGEARGLVARVTAWLWERRPRPVASTGQGGAARSASPSGWARLGAWRRARATPSEEAARPVEASRGRAVGAPSWLARFVGGLFSGARAPARTATAAPRPVAPPPPQEPGMLSRLSQWALRSTPLGRWVGRRKADYVRRLFDMFEQGNLQEALRHAIPLGGGGLTEQARVALELPGPREQLAINLRRGGAAGIFGSSDAVFAALKERYRAAFQRLEREGKIDEAAFVLTELLGAHEEAVSFLERHGRLRLAAELAEARALPAGLVVRQWFLARDVARALAIARRAGAFAEAVARLERQSNAAEARALRLLWAETLAEAGDCARAVDVVWPLEEARPLARAWLERGAAVGGPGGARSLARLALAFPQDFEALKGRALELLADESAERAGERLAFAEPLLSEPSSEARTALAGPLVRALLRDRAAGRVRVLPSGLPALLRDPGLGLLRADLPPSAERAEGPAATPWSTEVVEHLSASEAGAFAVYDAVPLPDGRVLVALGEAGARVLRADGTPVAHFDVPAFALVPSVHGDRALALAPRGELHRVSRLELGARRATPWCDARVDAFASAYDGGLWFVAEGSTVLAVDALAGDWRALWRVGQVGRRVGALAYEAERLSVLALEADTSAEVWTWSLPGPVLRARKAVKGEEGFAHAALRADGTVEFGEGLVLSSPWRARLAPGEAGYEAQLMLYGSGVVRARLHFEGPHAPRARFHGRELLVFDAAGRLARVDLAEGTVRRLRVL